MPRSGSAGSYFNSIFNFFEEIPYHFHSGCISLHPYQQCTRVLFSPHPCQHLIFLVFLIPATLTGDISLWFWFALPWLLPNAWFTPGDNSNNLYVPGIIYKHFIYINYLIFMKNLRSFFYYPQLLLLLSPVNKWRNWVIEKLINLPKVTQLVNSRVGFKPRQFGSRVHVLNHNIILYTLPQLLS